jgi:hydroxyacylglutathione hydrolase
MKCNCYVIESTDGNYIIDPGSNDVRFLQYLKDLQLDFDFIIATHCHFDHVGGVSGIIEELGIKKIYIHELELKNLKNCNLFSLLLEKKSFNTIDNKNIQTYKFGDNIEGMINILNLSGHTKGSSGLFHKSINSLFIGDALLKDPKIKKIANDLSYILKNKEFLNEVHSETDIYPGH